MKLAKSIASAAYRRLPNHPFEDIHAAALLGLTDAADRFNPKLGVPFECYARQRISGTIIDAHRALHKTPFVYEFPPEPIVEADEYTQGVRTDMLRKAVSPALKTLEPLELQIIRLRYGTDMTLSAIAYELGVSECHVSQVHRRTLEKLRPRLAGLD